MTNEERQKALDELLPGKKSINTHKKYMQIYPILLLVIGVIYLIWYVTNM